MNEITDQYGRTFKTLRVSLLSRCNLGCVYCSLADDKIKNNPVPENLMAVDDLLQLIERIHSAVQLETIRLTGGEPLLYPDLIQVISGLKAIGISEIKLTTNGFLLERMAMAMRLAGMKSINVSLDAMDEDIFFLMSKRNDVQRILQGIETAVAAGLEVKINTVLMKGINDSQLVPLLEYAFEKRITIRFLEIMAMGHLHQQSGKYLFTQQEILDVIQARYEFSRLERSNSSTSNYWQTKQGNLFGIIANESEPFCHDCNRLRLDSHGNIYGCLSNNHPISLNGVNNIQFREKLLEALLQKQSVRFTGSELSMLNIGG
ncbi:MAG: radical SAM protein [Chitinophagaceae bacterium]|nr:radical SAM protein [Chitinophagaceae bacterium]